MHELGYQQLMRHEGLRLKVYRCTAGHLTIGYGYNLDANPLRIPEHSIQTIIRRGITEPMAQRWLRQAVGLLEFDVLRLVDAPKLNEPRQAVVVNMAYNLGFKGFSEFKRMMRALRQEDYMQAALEMMDSKWATQVGNRAHELAKQMETGEWAS